MILASGTIPVVLLPPYTFDVSSVKFPDVILTFVLVITVAFNPPPNTSPIVPDDNITFDTSTLSAPFEAP